MRIRGTKKEKRGEEERRGVREHKKHEDKKDGYENKRGKKESEKIRDKFYNEAEQNNSKLCVYVCVCERETELD